MAKSPFCQMLLAPGLLAKGAIDPDSGRMPRMADVHAGPRSVSPFFADGFVILQPRRAKFNYAYLSISYRFRASSA
ncbi:hypothetical protein FIU90_03210 [Erythrobacter sp. THAF29]|nr:hypothetical protein FIU90_03210 [Erythrobacter sp. THAF29]